MTETTEEVTETLRNHKATMVLTLAAATQKEAQNIADNLAVELENENKDIVLVAEVTRVVKEYAARATATAE